MSNVTLGWVRIEEPHAPQRETWALGRITDGVVKLVMAEVWLDEFGDALTTTGPAGERWAWRVRLCENIPVAWPFGVADSRAAAQEAAQRAIRFRRIPIGGNP